MSLIVDPDSAVDIYAVHSSNTALATGGSFKLPDGKRIDIGLYEHVAVVVANCGGTATSTITITPRESDSQTGPEFPLNGTNGAPDFSFTFTTGVVTGTNASHQRLIRVAGRRQFLNVEISTVSASGTFRPAVYLLGIGTKSSTSKTINADLALVGPIV